MVQPVWNSIHTGLPILHQACEKDASDSKLIGGSPWQEQCPPIQRLVMMHSRKTAKVAMLRIPISLGVVLRNFLNGRKSGNKQNSDSISRSIKGLILVPLLLRSPISLRFTSSLLSLIGRLACGVGGRDCGIKHHLNVRGFSTPANFSRDDYPIMHRCTIVMSPTDQRINK